ncbi:MAG: stage 0 sporulation family protein [Desulfosarcinaceae bacterium]|nr:stage 0 sporulation family protein [Desulfosarcinaceae bacterium]
MSKIVGVRFKTGGKIYDFDSGAFVLKVDDPVIVETEKGLGFGVVAVAPEPMPSKKEGKQALKKVFRLATEKDFAQRAQNATLEERAHAYCLEAIKRLKLQMNLFSVESTFDTSRLTFFFTADGRVDFRQLVKILVKEFRVRIEMRQVGIRNQAKMCGGLGRCGRELCCSSFLNKFEPVSIRMAKEQGLSLNPTKISGQCGRLMCCLTYENETYIHQKKGFPKLGKMVNTEVGRGKVIRHNPLARQFTIRTEEGKEVDMGPDQVIRGPSPQDRSGEERSSTKSERSRRGQRSKGHRRKSAKRGAEMRGQENRRGPKGRPQASGAHEENAQG